jgi:hypothetical protein
MRHFCLVTWWLIGLAWIGTVSAQTDITTDKDSTEVEQAIVTKKPLKRRNYSRNDYLTFPNLGKVPFYYDKGKLRKIAKAEKKKETKKLLARLEQYVNAFGIQNFYKDTYLIWRLAQLNDALGRKDQAVQLYRLVLKHERYDVTVPREKYDSLTKSWSDLYVPLSYYYELVDYRKTVDTLQAPRSVLTNMGKSINSKAEDYGPAISVDGKTLLFTSKRKRVGFAGIPDEDIYMTYNSDYGWTDATVVRSLNTIFNEGSACLSRDGKRIFFSRCNSPDSYGNCDIFTARLREDSIWVDVKNLGIAINSTSWDSHPSLSHSGDTLFFASDRIGGFGLSDIYFSVKNKNGEWTQARNMGPVINTSKNEVSPYYHPQYDVLYFSSNGHLVNFGDFDIFKSYLLNGQWSEPKNIGPLINTAGSEYYFTIDFDSKDLFYARGEPKDLKNLDLYSFPVPMGGQALATTTLAGTLLNAETGDAFRGIVSVIDLDKRIEIEPKFTREDGSFDFELIDNTNYLLIVQGDEFFRVEQMIYLNGDTQLDIEAKPIKNRKWKFNSIEFEENSSHILDTMKPDLSKVIKFMVDNPEYKLIITGHTDLKGNADANQRLSQERANAIRDYILVGSGIKPVRIESYGLGSSSPIFEVELDETQRKINRRVEFQIVKIGELPDLDSELEDF